MRWPKRSLLVEMTIQFCNNKIWKRPQVSTFPAQQNYRSRLSVQRKRNAPRRKHQTQWGRFNRDVKHSWDVTKGTRAESAQAPLGAPGVRHTVLQTGNVLSFLNTTHLVALVPFHCPLSYPSLFKLKSLLQIIMFIPSNRSWGPVFWQEPWYSWGYYSLALTLHLLQSANGY